MKKLLTMILIITFSLPVAAAEVILECHIKDDSAPNISVTEIYGFDEELGTVFRIVDSGAKKLEVGEFINKTSFGSDFNGMRWQISRMDGAYKFDGKFTHGTGKCTRFTQAF